MSRAEEYKRRHGMLAQRRMVGVTSATDRAVEATPRPNERRYRSTVDDGFSGGRYVDMSKDDSIPVRGDLPEGTMMPTCSCET